MIVGAIFASMVSVAATVPAVRPISDAERAAVSVVTQYLAAGPEAVWKHLAPDASLRDLKKADALSEIATRLGPADDATWTLHTAVPSLAHRLAVFGVDFGSGADDTIVFGMRHEKGAWAVESIRTSAEPMPVTARTIRPQPGGAADEHWTAKIDRRLALVIILPALLLGVMATAIRSVAMSRVFLAISALSVIAASVLMAFPFIARDSSVSVVRSDPVATIERAAPKVVEIQLRDLAALRRAFATGELGAFERFTPSDPHLRDVATQWRVALQIRAERFDEARKGLDSLSRHSAYSMAELLRARLAYLETKEVDAVSAYERAIAIGPGRDQLWLEAAAVLAILGFDERAEKYFERTASIGTREPAVYYALAGEAAMEGREKEAEELLLTAWDMQPVERSRLVGMPVLWRIVRRPAVARVLQLHKVDEASFAGGADRPIVLPDGARAEVSGNHLRLRAGGAELDVPGGSAIAPAEAHVLDAGAWGRRMEEEALSRLAQLRSEAASATAFADPTFRDRCLNTAAELSEENRWNDLVALTDALSARDERVPLELMVLRGRALARLDRLPELRPLIRDLLLNPSFRRKKDPASMRHIAELLAVIDDYDSAIVLLGRAREQMPLPGIEQRITQLEIERRLASGYSVLKTEHFDVQFPPDTDSASIRKLAEILESEYRRLRPVWFPSLRMRRVTVNVLWWQDFRQYSGSDYIAGLFTNEMFLPLAGLDVFSPPFVSIITHELLHAMLYDATKNLAPRWFHEALASRVEMNEVSQNGFLKYRDDRYLSVGLLDAVAEGSVDPELIGEAYSLGESTLRYIESTHGRRAVLAMIDAFRRGADTTEAVRSATKMSVAELDLAARAWGNAQPLLFEGDVVRYDGSDRRVGFRR